MSTVCLPGWGMRPGVFDGVVPSRDCHAALPYGGTLPAFIDRLAQRASNALDVVGWSLGAIVALAWAMRFPGQVRRLVLFAATPCFVQRDGWSAAMAAPVFRQFADGLRADRTAALRRFSLLQAGGESDARDAARRVQQQLVGQETGTEELMQALEWLENTDLRAELPSVRVPVLLIHGKHDGLVPVTAAEALAAAIPHARLEVLAGAGHAPLLTQTETAARLTREFLQ